MKTKLMALALCMLSTGVFAAELKVRMLELGEGKAAGRLAGIVTVTETEYGAVFTPNLTGLPNGLHGFHVHINPSCGTTVTKGKKVIGGAAGGHFDPAKTGKHGFPWSNDNHLGDLPPLYVDMEGNAMQPVLAPRLKLADLKGRSLMIHAGGDNHSDHPSPLGGGGARIVCGVF